MSQENFGSGFSGDDRPVDNIRRGATEHASTFGGQGTQAGATLQAPESVVGDDIQSGGSNVTGGVARRKRRNVKGLTGAKLQYGVSKNYRTSAAVLFNNFDEIVQDSISREYAQEIIEELFDEWNVPTQFPEVATYAENLIWAFLVATTASNKADYNREFEIPSKGDSIEANFAIFSNLLSSVHGVTRRQFARAVADDLRNYLRKPENQSMIPKLATRIGCDPQFAHLAFDGSTHCTGMTSREVSFTKTLESRNLFEDDSVHAVGSSDRLMQGIPTGPRAVIPR